MVAVLLATYNGEKYITELLDSLLAQSYSDFKIFVHDDGSYDETRNIINDYCAMNPGRFEVIEGHPTKEPKKNFFYLMSQVEADYYLFCDQDDIWLENKVKRSLNELGRLEISKGSINPACVFTDMYVTDAELNILSSSFIAYLGRSIKNTRYSQILIDNPAAGCTMCFNRALRDIVVDSLKYVDRDAIPMHDQWTLLLASIYGHVKGINDPFVYYRQTGENNMGASTESTSEKVKRNLKDSNSGSFRAKKRAFIMEARNLAKEVLKLSVLPMDKKDVLEQFVELDSKPKLYRMRFYRRHKFTRAQNNLWMRLWV